MWMHHGLVSLVGHPHVWLVTVYPIPLKESLVKHFFFVSEQLPLDIIVHEAVSPLNEALSGLRQMARTWDPHWMKRSNLRLPIK